MVYELNGVNILRGKIDDWTQFAACNLQPHGAPACHAWYTMVGLALSPARDIRTLYQMDLKAMRAGLWS